MRRVRLIHWNETEAKEKAALLEAAGYAVEFKLLEGPQLLRDVRENPPDAVVIDLSRLPSQGRDVGLLLRFYKSTRMVPLLFLEGDRSKVDRIKKLLPDACYTSWDRITSSLKQEIARPRVHPVAAKSVFAAYAGRPLAKKLGIKPNSVVALVHAPPAFGKKLRGMPPGVTIKYRVAKGTDVTLWFNRSRAEYVREVKAMTRAIGTGKLWIVWPKQGGALAADLTEQDVRASGLAAGLVDYKICSIDATWSGLLFTRRKKILAK